MVRVEVYAQLQKARRGELHLVSSAKPKLCIQRLDSALAFALGQAKFGEHGSGPR